ncbi:MAG: hypothetical protein Tsb0018_05410 [Opitutales bacterium]|tara:strand:- start:2267 stop:2752 length:486 start_codon:yes stop_codon:yes gene_type:complete
MQENPFQNFRSKRPRPQNGFQTLWRLLQSCILIALGVMLAAHTSSGIRYDNGSSLLLVVALFSFLNIVLKPLLVFFTLPFIVFTFGLGLWLINAFLLMLVSELVQGFHVASFASALWGAFVISLTSMVVNSLLNPMPPRNRRGQGDAMRRNLRQDDDVIDI